MPGFEIHHYSPSLFSLLDAERIFVHLFGNSPHAFWLDSSRVMEGFSRYSVMGDASGPLGEVITYKLKGKQIEVRKPPLPLGERGTSADSVRVETLTQPSPYKGEELYGDIFEYLTSQLQQRSIPSTESYAFPTGLGYVGYFGYELKALCGAQAAHDSKTLDAAFIFCDRAIVFDHLMQKTYLMCLTEEGNAESARKWFEEVERKLHLLPELQPVGKIADSPPVFTARHEREKYIRMVERCQQHILDGDSYEICLTNQFSAKVKVEALAAYRKLRHTNPAPNSAYMRFDDLHVLCSSPERFLQIDTKGRVESKPIKGTIKRGDTPSEDARLKLKLSGSVKDRAENLMIVDLLRNDLGKVCETGSVQVPELFAVESYTHVHHLVSTISGQLRMDVSPLDCIRAAFPGGSMTGAPKLRTMEILDDLEAGPRGIYSGALGYMSLNGQVDLNIVIRTIIVTADEVSFGSGGAITSESDPAAEWEELELKAEALKRTLS